MSDIPPELITDILYPLPVKSLLRFRCVCKSWKSLIDSPNFIKAHLKRQQLVKPNSDMKLILKGDSLFSIDFSSICSKYSMQLQELEHPLNHLDGPTRIVGSCDGLLLLGNSLNDNGLWNPSTKMWRRLPTYCIEPPQGIGMTQYRVGVGYDASSDDYKVVRIDQWFICGKQHLGSAIMIYSLKFGSWKEVEEGCPCWLEDGAAFVGGVLHWIPFWAPTMGPLSSFCLIGFNLERERFERVPSPENLGKRFRLNLTVLEKCLCLLTSHLSVHSNAEDDVLDCVDIWVMKDYGVKESWIKLFSVEQLNGGQHFSYVKPKAYSVTGKEVLLEMDNSKLWWYNLEKKSLELVKITGGLEFSEANVCLGTLVPLYRKKNIEPNVKTRAKSSDKEDDFLKEGFKLKL